MIFAVILLTTGIVYTYINLKSVNREQFLDYNKIWLEVGEVDTLLLPAMKFISNPKAKKVCSFGPYSEFSSIKGRDEQKMMKDVDIFPVGEGNAILVYFDEKSDVIGKDVLWLNKGKTRWFAPAEPSDRFCLDLDQANIRIVNQKDYLQLRLE